MSLQCTILVRQYSNKFWVSSAKATSEAPIIKVGLSWCTKMRKIYLLLRLSDSCLLKTCLVRLSDWISILDRLWFLLFVVIFFDVHMKMLQAKSTKMMICSASSLSCRKCVPDTLLQALTCCWRFFSPAANFVQDKNLGELTDYYKQETPELGKYQ